MSRGEYTIAEIMSQPVVWEDALATCRDSIPTFLKTWEEQGFEQVILTGCGSTYYAALIGATLIQAAGIPARAYPASELMLYPAANFSRQTKTLLITVSRSGATRETIEAVRCFREHGNGLALTVTCTSESELAGAVDVVLAIDAAREESRAQTRSFSSMVFVLQGLAAALAGQDYMALLAPLPAIVGRLLADYDPRMRAIAENTTIEQFVFLGTGPLYGLACEAALKMIETTLVPSMTFHALEFLHGPRYIINKQTVLIALLDETLHDEEIKAVQEAAQRGAQLLVVDEGTRDLGLAEPFDRVALTADVPMVTRAILYLPVLQLLFYYLSMKRGKNPDRPA